MNANCQENNWLLLAENVCAKTRAAPTAPPTVPAHPAAATPKFSYPHCLAHCQEWHLTSACQENRGPPMLQTQMPQCCAVTWRQTATHLQLDVGHARPQVRRVARCLIQRRNLSAGRVQLHRRDGVPDGVRHLRVHTCYRVAPRPITTAEEASEVGGSGCTRCLP